jgi:hypothetical protein
VIDLDAAGINSKGNVPVLKKRCQQAGISIEKTLDKLIPGFVGKPKGALQIVYERGFNDSNKNNAGSKIVSWEGLIIKDTSDNNRAQEVPGSHRHDQHQGQARKKPKKCAIFVQFCRIVKTSRTRSPSWNCDYTDLIQ